MQAKKTSQSTLTHQARLLRDRGVYSVWSIITHIKEYHKERKLLLNCDRGVGFEQLCLKFDQWILYCTKKREKEETKQQHSKKFDM
jgi:hypothetical protein